MYLPPSTLASDQYGLDVLRKGSSGNTPSAGGWSSLIGVVTAICGNILISFALNTQRYAHLRLSRDRERVTQHEKRKTGRGKASSSASQPGYGTTQKQQREQEQIAERRANFNAKAQPPDAHTQEDGDAEDSGETQPLIPKVNGKAASTLSDDDTAREEDEGDGDDDDTAIDDKDDPARKEKSYLRSPIWWLGISLMVVGEAGNFLAYGFAPASIVSPLGVVALVSNCMIAPLLLGEKFRWRDGFGVLVAIAGCVVVVLSASASNPKLTPDAIWRLITKWEFETYFGITVVLIIALAVASTKFGEKSILIDLGLVALFGGYTALSTKGVASLLSNTIFRVVTFPITYLLVAVLVFTAVMQIKYVNRALQRFNATMVIPTQFVLFTISVILGSAVLYRDFEREEAGDAIKFVCGCALTFFGVWCITSGHGRDSDNDQEQEDEADAVDLVDEESVMPEIHAGGDGVDERHASFNLATSTDMPVPMRTRTLDVVPQSVQESSDVAFSPPAVGLLGISDASTLSERLSHMAPGNASTIHPYPVPMTQNGSASTAPPPLHATMSAPTVPTVPTGPSLSGSFRPKTPITRTPSGPATDSPTKHPATAPRVNSVTLLDPESPMPQHRLLNRHSVVGLLPGPLTSPLSGSLSAIVADELRRSTSLSLRRRPGKSQSRPRALFAQVFDRRSSGSAGRPKRHSIASVDFEAEEAAAQLRREAVAHAGSPPAITVDSPGGAGRMRSLSATLGEIFGSTSRIARRTDRSEAADGDDVARGRARPAEPAEPAGESS